MENTIDIKNWKTGKIIFSYTCEDNTIKKTVEEAVKQGINLSYADLKNTDLSYICLKRACLSYANLSKTNLRKSNLWFADLSHANLKHAILNSCKLVNAGLNNSDLSYADLTFADLSFTKLNNTKLKHANLSNADLDYVSNLEVALLDKVESLNTQCPKEGSFIGWKKCIGADKKYYIVKLEIPEDAKRSSSTTMKCRCNRAKVLDIQKFNGTKADINEVYSEYDKNFKYKVGETVEVPNFDERYWKECAPGIHFFMRIYNVYFYF